MTTYTLPPTLIEGDNLTEDFTLGVIDSFEQLQLANWDEWQIYVPVLAGAGWAKGAAGTIDGRYSIAGGTVHFWVRVFFSGAGVAFGAGAPNISLPVPAHAAHAAFAGRLGVAASFADAAPVADIDGIGEIIGAGTAVNLLAKGSAGAYTNYVYISNVIPFAWAAGDVLRVAGWYQKA